MSKNKPKIGLFLGHPTGIGPEVTAKLLSQSDILEHSDLVVIGDQRIFEMGQHHAGVKIPVNIVNRINDVDFGSETIQFLDFPTVSPEELELGSIDIQTGKSVLDTLSFVLKLAKAKHIDGVIYAPLNKEGMRVAGSPHKDGMGFCVNTLGWKGVYCEMNVFEGLWISRVTSHVSIKELPSLVTQKRVFDIILLMHGTMSAFGFEKPRLAIASLNPHGGEGGLFGMEEINSISPAIQQAKSEGIDANGPFPPDTIFLRVKKEKYDGLVSMYHDQCQIAYKLLGFDKGFAFHGGSPVPTVTTSHGTAFDIVGKGVANLNPLREGYLAVCRIASNKDIIRRLTDRLK
jgi:4-hydroxythreonine-4-phosphate dehydrogenase